MKFRFDSTTQLKFEINTYHGKMYAFMHRHSRAPGQPQKYEWIRLGAPFIGIASGFLTVATRVALVGESIIKGIGNIIGYCLGIRDAKLGKGLSFLVVGTIGNTILLPFSLLNGIKNATRDTFAYLVPNCINTPILDGLLIIQ